MPCGSISTRHKTIGRGRREPLESKIPPSIGLRRPEFDAPGGKGMGHSRDLRTLDRDPRVIDHSSAHRTQRQRYRRGLRGARKPSLAIREELPLLMKEDRSQRWVRGELRLDHRILDRRSRIPVPHRKVGPRGFPTLVDRGIVSRNGGKWTIHGPGRKRSEQDRREGKDGPYRKKHLDTRFSEHGLVLRRGKGETRNTPADPIQRRDGIRVRVRSFPVTSATMR